MSKILLTGGSGFIGRHFHNAVPNNQLTVLDLNRPDFQNGSKVVQGDIRKLEDIRRALEGDSVTSIISLAAKHHDFGIGHDEYFDTNEGGTATLCTAADEFGISEITFYSSVAVYGVREEISSESTVPEPDSPYGASKLAGEKILVEWAKKDPKRKVLIIRPTVVFGPNNKANMYNLIRQVDSRLYFHLGKADNVKSIAYVENLVDATLVLKQKMAPGVSIYNYSDEPQLTARQISETIAGALGKKIHFTIPRRLGIAAGIPFDLAIKITGRNFPISTSRIRKLGTQTLHSAKKIVSEGYSPRYTTVEGLKKMVEWYLSEGRTREISA